MVVSDRSATICIRNTLVYVAGEMSCRRNPHRCTAAIGAVWPVSKASIRPIQFYSMTLAKVLKQVSGSIGIVAFFDQEAKSFMKKKAARNRTGGYVYVLSNPSMPGIVKIGKTNRNPNLRLRELSSATGVPTPFKIEGVISTNKPDQAEKMIHQILDGRRMNRRREFFHIPPKQAVKLSKRVAYRIGGRFRSARVFPPVGKRRRPKQFWLSSVLTACVAGYWINELDQNACWAWMILCAFCLLSDRPKVLREALRLPAQLGLFGYILLFMATSATLYRHDKALIDVISSQLHALGV